VAALYSDGLGAKPQKCRLVPLYRETYWSRMRKRIVGNFQLLIVSAVKTCTQRLHPQITIPVVAIDFNAKFRDFLREIPQISILGRNCFAPPPSPYEIAVFTPEVTMTLPSMSHRLSGVRDGDCRCLWPWTVLQLCQSRQLQC